jgi:hypothetical protein
LWGPNRRFRPDQLRRHLGGYYLRHPAALAKRIATMARHGLVNHYLTIVWKKDR